MRQQSASEQADELVRIKAGVNLVEFAVVNGYSISKKSTKAWVVLRKGDDTIIVSRRDGVCLYFNPADDNDQGTVLDFLRVRNGFNIGQSRVELRPWIQSARSSPSSIARKGLAQPVAMPAAAKPDTEAVSRLWHSMAPYSGSYLTDVRGISPLVIGKEDIRQDARGNACFAHRDLDGEVICFEIKGPTTALLATGGLKGICQFGCIDNLRRVVVTESSVDALSFHMLHTDDRDAVISTAGQPSVAQLALLSDFFAAIAVVVIATDRDAGGDQIAEKILGVRPDALRMMPEGNDWNEDLVMSRDPAALPSPTARPA